MWAQSGHRNANPSTARKNAVSQHAWQQQLRAAHQVGVTALAVSSSLPVQTAKAVTPTRMNWLGSFGKHLPQEFDAFGGDFVARRFDAAPDGRSASDDLDVRGEGFNDNIALVTNALERGGDWLPIDVIVAGRAAITAASVEMGEVLAGFANRGA